MWRGPLLPVPGAALPEALVPWKMPNSSIVTFEECHSTPVPIVGEARMMSWRWRLHPGAPRHEAGWGRLPPVNRICACGNACCAETRSSSRFPTASGFFRSGSKIPGLPAQWLLPSEQSEMGSRRIVRSRTCRPSRLPVDHYRFSESTSPAVLTFDIQTDQHLAQ